MSGSRRRVMSRTISKSKGERGSGVLECYLMEGSLVIIKTLVWLISILEAVELFLLLPTWSVSDCWVAMGSVDCLTDLFEGLACPQVLRLSRKRDTLRFSMAGLLDRANLFFPLPLDTSCLYRWLLGAFYNRHRARSPVNILGHWRLQCLRACCHNFNSDCSVPLAPLLSIHYK